MAGLDGAAVAPGRGTYSERRRLCGCRGVPDGQHLAGCVEAAVDVPEARECPRCGFHSADIESGSFTRCGICGSVKP